MRSRVVVSVCFFLMGVGYLVALSLELYRIVPISLALAVMIAVTGSDKNRRKQSGIKIARGMLFAAPVYLFAIASASWSPETSTAFRDALYMCIAVMPAILLGIVLAHRFSSTNIANGFFVLILPFAGQALINVFISGDPMILGKYSIRSILTAVLCLSAPILVGAWLQTKQYKYFWSVLAVLVSLFIIRSRSALIIVPLAMLMSIYLHDRRLAMRVVVVIFPIMALLVAFYPMEYLRFSSDSTNIDVGEAVINDIRSGAEGSVDIDRRLAIYTSTKIFLDNPLVGGGYSSVLQTNISEYDHEVSAHGLIPGTLSELGLVGFFVLVLTTYKVVVRAKIQAQSEINKNQGRMLSHFIVGFYATLFLGLFHQIVESIFFGLILGLLIGAGQTGNKYSRS